MKNTIATKAFIALGQDNRLSVFRLIVQRGDKGLTPTKIKELLGIPSATLSFHLRELLLANLVLVERNGRSLTYKPNVKFTNELMKFLLENCCNGEECLSVIKLKKKIRN